MRSIKRALCSSMVVIAIAGCHDSTAPGDGTLPLGLTLKADPFVTTGLTSPVFMTQPLNDGRILVVEQDLPALTEAVNRMATHLGPQR